MQSRNSGYGFASLTAASAGGIAMMLLRIGAAVFGPGPRSIVVVDLLLIAFLLLNAMSVALGIAGLVERHAAKRPALLGTAFSAVTLTWNVCAIALGTFEPR